MGSSGGYSIRKGQGFFGRGGMTVEIRGSVRLQEWQSQTA
jgi:hypothetical protein